MADTAALKQSGTATAVAGRRSGGFRHGLGQRALPIFTTLAIVYLMIPILVMIVFSFNKPEGKFNYIWSEFSLDGWAHPFDWPGLGDAVLTSLGVALLSTLIATIRYPGAGAPLSTGTTGSVRLASSSATATRTRARAGSMSTPGT